LAPNDFTLMNDASCPVSICLRLFRILVHACIILHLLIFPRTDEEVLPLHLLRFVSQPPKSLSS